MNDYIDRLGATFFGTYLPNLLAALAVLVIGTIAAWLIAGLVKSLLKRTTFDDKLAAWLTADSEGPPPKIESIIGRVVFWLLMAFVLVGFFQVLGLSAVAGPLDGFLDKTVGFLPNLFGAAVLLLVAWLIARVLRFLVRKAVTSSHLQERLVAHSEADKKPVDLAKTLSESVYWLVFLLFLPAVLDTLGLDGLLAPVEQLLEKVLSFLPNLLAAALIIVIGWFFARVLQRIVTSLLIATGIDRVGERVGMSSRTTGRTLSSAIGLVLYILVLIPVIIAGLNALKIESLTRPASEMLNSVLLAIPRLFAAALVIVIAYFVGRILAGFVANLLAAVGFDEFLDRIGLVRRPSETIDTPPIDSPDATAVPSPATKKPSVLVGSLVMIGLMLFAVIEGLRLLEFEALAAIVVGFTAFAGNVLLAIVVFALGMYLAGLAADAIRSSGVQRADTLATVARGAILVLASAMALRQAGVAEDIILLTFGLLLGSVAVAIAIAFGGGGRDMAKHYLERWNEQAESASGSTGGSSKPPQLP